MSGAESVFIRRVRNGFVVRAGLADEWYCPDLSSAIACASSELADSQASGPTPMLSEAPVASEAADESLADQVVEALEKLDGADPDDDATIFLARRLVKNIRGTVPPAVETRIVEIVREKLRVKRLLEAHPPATRRRKETS